MLHKALGAIPWDGYGSQWGLPVGLIGLSQKASENRQEQSSGVTSISEVSSSQSLHFRPSDYCSSGWLRRPVKSSAEDQERWG